MTPPEYKYTNKSYWPEARQRLEMVRFHPRCPEPLKFQAELLILEANKMLEWEKMSLSESDFMTAHLVLMMEMMDLLEERPQKPNWRTYFINLFRGPSKDQVLNLELPYLAGPNQEALRLSMYRRLLTFMRSVSHPPLPNLVVSRILPDVLRRVNNGDGSRWPLPLFEVLVTECPYWNLAYLLLGIGYPTLPKSRQVHNREIEPKLADLHQDVRDAAAKHIQEADVEVLANLYTPQVTQIRVLETTVAILLDVALGVLLDNPQILLDRQGTPFNQEDTFHVLALPSERPVAKKQSR